MSLEGTKGVYGVAWDYARDTVRVKYDRRRTSPWRLARVISGHGFDVKETSSASASSDAVKSELAVAPVPHDAPAFFRAAFERARSQRKPLVIDFWAQWCPSCIRLKKETLEHPTVTPYWKDVELVYVDLDEHPALGAPYGVAAIPDLFFVDRDGRIVDRLRTFESPQALGQRIRSLLNEH